MTLSVIFITQSMTCCNTRWLLERGASVHVRDALSDTPLVSAVRAGHLGVVRVLAQCGAHLDLCPAQVIILYPVTVVILFPASWAT